MCRITYWFTSWLQMISFVRHESIIEIDNTHDTVLRRRHSHCLTLPSGGLTVKHEVN